MRNKIMVLTVFLAVFIAVFALAGKKSRLPKEAVAMQGSYIEGLRVLNRNNGELIWAFTSAKAVVEEDGDTINLKKVSVIYPSENVNVEADGGTYEMNSGGVSLRGTITAVRGDLVITSESLNINEGSQLWTDDEVTLTGNRFKITGKGLRGDEDEFKLSNVRAEFF